jgi:uncharacterized protein YhjY with autotransporter beta-barrel domain
VRRSPFACLLLAGVSVPASADDLTISSQVKSPVFTATAANNSPGDITIETGGSVTVAVQGAAATLNSNNTIDNVGVIQNTFTGNGAIGVHIIGGNTGTFTSEAGSTTEISAGGGNGTSNIGVLLDGTQPFNGNITLGSSSNLVTIGANSIGISIQAPLNGSLAQGATATLVGPNITGMSVTAPISGSLTNSGSIGIAGNSSDLTTSPNPFSAAAAQPSFGIPGVLATSAETLYPISGSALAIGANVGGGILNAGPTGTGDSTPAAFLTNASTFPALEIQPSVAGLNAANIVIGGSSDPVNPDFSLLNRGEIENVEKFPGISTIGVQIGETSNAANTVTLTGGIFNSGTIAATAESDNLNDTKNLQPASSNATALVIGSGATINASGTTAQALLNNGTISSTTTGNLQDLAQFNSIQMVSTALLIQPGGSLPSIATTGTITATAGTSDVDLNNLTAYAIRDLSGTLTTITNTGTISAIATPLNNNAQQTTAIDISHSSANETITTSGPITGDVLFGSAGMNGSVAGNQLVIEGATATGTVASVSGSVVPASGGTIDVHVSQGGTGGVLDTADARLSTLGVGEGGTVDLALNQSSLGTPVISATGPVTFGFGSNVTLVPTSFLPNNGTYTLIHSDTSLSFSDFSAATQQPIPYLFNGSITQSGNDLVITLQRKTAAELGLTGNAAALYEPLAQSALTDNPFGAALLSLTNAQDVQAAVNANVPDVGGGVRALAIAMTDSATGVVGARERNLVLSAANQQDEFRFWAQEVYDGVSAGTTATTSGYTGQGQGVALGVEFGALPDIRYGLAFTFFASSESEAHPADNKTDGDWHLLSFYAGWRPGNFFITPELNLGQADYTSRRGVPIGDVLTRTANANWIGYLGSAAVTTGYVLPMGVFQLIPELSVDGLYLHQNNINEKNAGAADLNINAQNEQSLRGFAGFLTQGAFAWAGGTVQPQMLLGWSYDVLNKPSVVNAYFRQAPTATFQLTGPDVGGNRFIGGVGLSYAVGAWSAGINYDVSLTTGAIAQSATFSLSSRF